MPLLAPVTPLPNRNLEAPKGASALWKLLRSLSTRQAVGDDAIVTAWETGAWRLDPQETAQEGAIAGIGLLQAALAGERGIAYPSSGYEPDLNDASPLWPALLSAGPSLWAPCGNGSTAADQALCAGNRVVLKAAIACNPDWANRQVKIGQRALPWVHQATQHEALSVLELLLAHGADPNQPDADGHPPLAWARTEATVALLKGAGASLDAAGPDGSTFLAFWTQQGLEGSRLDGMKKALGATKSPTGEAAVRTFFGLMARSPKGTLVAEARRLKLTGAETYEGKGWVQAAAERLAVQRFSGTERNKALSWWAWVSTQEAVVQKATETDLAWGWVVAQSQAERQRWWDRWTARQPDESRRDRVLERVVLAHDALAVSTSTDRLGACLERLNAWLLHHPHRRSPSGFALAQGWSDAIVEEVYKNNVEPPAHHALALMATLNAQEPSCPEAPLDATATALLLVLWGGIQSKSSYMPGRKEATEQLRVLLDQGGDFEAVPESIQAQIAADPRLVGMISRSLEQATPAAVARRSAVRL